MHSGAGSAAEPTAAPELLTRARGVAASHGVSTFLIGIVHNRESVEFVALGTTPDEIDAQLSRFVAQSVQHQLRAGEAAQVEALLAKGRKREAIAAYFDFAGGDRARWDPQRLSVRTVVT